MSLCLQIRPGGGGEAGLSNDVDTALTPKSANAASVRVSRGGRVNTPLRLGAHKSIVNTVHSGVA
jgi:hypothetical protein